MATLVQLRWWSLGERDTVAGSSPSPAPRLALTAAAAAVKAGRVQITPRAERWQSELWEYYDSLGEFRFAIDWRSETISRIRLRAARRRTGRDEPEIQDKGPAAELVADLAGGVGGGQAQLLSTITTLLDVPGEGWIVGERIDGSNARWQVRSSDEIRRGVTRRRGRGASAAEVTPEVIDDEASALSGTLKWRALEDEYVVVRVWRPHRRYTYLADSRARPALKTMRELELVNRKIESQYLSRLASAGLVVFPSEVEFPVREEFQDAPNPFVLEWIATAREAIATPGTAAAVVPIPIKVPGEFVDKIKFIDFTLRIDEKDIEKRDSAIRRLATQVDIPAEILTGLASANHWCCPSDTDVLTKAGWRGEADLQIGDFVYGVDHETGLADWRPVTDIYRADVVDEPMLSIEGRYHSSLTTMAHRWPVVRAVDGKRVWLTSRDLLAQDQARSRNSSLSVKIMRGAPSAAIPMITKYDDALVELVAWVFTEGSLFYASPEDALPKSCRIYQSHAVNADNCARITRALTSLYGSERPADQPSMWRTRQYDNGKTVFSLCNAAWLPIVEHCPHRIVTSEFVDSLTKSQLLLFVDTAIRGDGHRMAGKTRIIGQKDPRCLDAVERAAILLGFATNRRDSVHQGFHEHTMHNVSISERVMYRPRAGTLSETTYTGRIWCPTVPPTHTMLVRRHGKVFYTGQSAWLLEESAIKVHISPTVELICGALTTGYLTPALEARDEDPTDWVVWYDASEITLRPDRSQGAKDAYDRFELSGEALRREIGFDEDDMPDDEELKTQVLKKLAQDPGNALVALGELTGETFAAAVAATGAPPDASGKPPEGEKAPADGPPSTRDAEPPAPGSDTPATTAAVAEALVHARRAGVITRQLAGGQVRNSRLLGSRHVTGDTHQVELTMDGWWLAHPATCVVAPHECLYSLAAAAHPGIRPGASGTYACRLDGDALRLGPRLLHQVNGG